MPRTFPSLAFAAALLAATPSAQAATQKLMDACSGADPDKSIAACTKIIDGKKETKEDRAWAHSNRGVGYENKGDLDRAFADYNEAIRLDPKFGDAYRNRGDMLNFRGDLDAGIADLDVAVRLNPKDHYAYNSRGVAYYFKGDLDRAIFDFDTAITLSRNGYSSVSEPALYYSNRAEAYLDKGEYEKAAEDIAVAIGTDRESPGGFANRGRLHSAKGENDLAIADLSQAIKLQPDNGLALALRGEVYAKKGDAAHAKADFDAALAISAKTLDDRKAQDKARKGLAALNSEAPESGNANAVVAGLAGRSGGGGNAQLWRDCEPEWTESLALRDPEPDTTIGACSVLIESHARRDDHWSRRRSRDESESVYYYRGRAYQTKQDWDRALADYDKSIILNEVTPGTYLSSSAACGAYFGRGEIAEVKGDHDQAARDYDKAKRTKGCSGEIARALIEKQALVAAATGQPQPAAAAPTDPALQEVLDRTAGILKMLGATPSGVSSPNQAAVPVPPANPTPPAAPPVQQASVEQASGNASAGVGGCDANQGDPDRTISACTQAIELDSDNADALLERARAYMVKERFDLALFDSMRAGKLGPDKLKISAKYIENLARSRLANAGGTPSPAPVQQAAAEPVNAVPAAPHSAPQSAAPSLAGQPQPVVPPDDGAQVEKPVLTQQATQPVQQAAIEPQAPAPQPAAPTAPAAAPLGKRVALVIGNSAYQNTTPLPNPSNDASDVAAALKRLGFDVIEEENLDKRGMDDAFRRFAREMGGADAAMFYYAGHAMEWQGANYLMPVDAKLEDEADVPYEMAKLNDMIADMGRVKAVRIAVLDACRNNPLEDRLKRSIALTRGGAQTRGLARIEKADGLVVAYSTTAGNVAEDGRGRNSPFTKALLENIETPGLEVGVLFRRVMGSVKQATEGKQHPELSILLDSEFYFKPGG